jgi:hypothetical protein
MQPKHCRNTLHSANSDAGRARTALRRILCALARSRYRDLGIGHVVSPRFLHFVSLSLALRRATTAAIPRRAASARRARVVPPQAP